VIKQLIKSVVGQNNIIKTKQYIKYLKDVKYLYSNPRIVVKENDLLYQKFPQGNKHVFFGYYDISQFDQDEKRLLVHVVGKHADAHKDKAELGYYNVDTCEYTPLASTDTWCWQQGARLRWHPSRRECVLFNDLENGQYVTRIYNLAHRKEVGCLCSALYDVDSTMSFGLSVNFSRLQRLRPGYGYSKLPDATENLSAPENDGIFYIDIQNNTKKLLISLSQLAADISDPKADQHYINHISVSPDGKKFMFFHIWTLKGDTHWRTRLCVYDLITNELHIIEKQNRVSHYDWKNNNELLVTCEDSQREQYYCIYDIKKRAKTVLKNKKLNHDGHPTIFGNEGCFISDTYPLVHDMQTVFKYDFTENWYKPIIMLYSDALLYGEKRCDLHPRVSKSEKYITLDTTCENGCRQVMLIKNWKGK